MSIDPVSECNRAGDAGNAPLLASDLDGTLIAAEPSRRHVDAVSDFGERVRARRLALMYVTGRHLQLALSGIDGAGLPRPDVVACDVGTSLYWPAKHGFRLDEAYRARIESTPGVMTAADIRDALARETGFRLQEPAKQADFKVSYYVDLERTRDDLVESLERRLEGGTRTRLVWSRDATTGVGLLDVLPAAVGKETAVAFAARHLARSRDDVIFAGDSGNDRDAILAGWRAIVVGNARDELKEELRSHARARGLDDRVYFAESEVAGGVIEGLGHFGVI